MRRCLLLAAPVILSVVLLSSPAAACLWDRDTLAAEAEGLPEVVHVLTGRFPVNPPLFYEIRLERVSRQLQQTPDDLAAYDDAGVACDRLERGKEAIGWMERKRLALERSALPDPEMREHRYRYLANLGTFHVHHWIHGGAQNIEHLRRAHEFITEAVKLNPDAHFGRERYQLLAIEALLGGVGDTPGQGHPGAPATLLERPDWSEKQRRRIRHPRSLGGEESAMAALGYPDAVQGLTGLIVLGNAWGSIDVFYALALALQHEGHSSLSYLAQQRTQDLVELGRYSKIPGGPSLERPPDFQTFLRPADIEKLNRYHDYATKVADYWRKQRIDFMMERLRRGEHPDTHPKFWQGFAGEPAPPLPGSSLRERLQEHSFPIVVILVALALSSFFCLAYLRERRSRGTAAK